MNFLDILIVKWQLIAWNKTRRINFFTWAILGIGGISGSNMCVYPAIAFLVIGIETLYAQTTKFNKLLPVKKSRILLVDFIVYYLAISITSIVLFLFFKGEILQSILYGTIIFSIGVILKYCNSIISGTMLMLSVIGSIFLKTNEAYKIINRIIANSLIIIIIIFGLIILSYVISLILYKKRIFINRI
ncbi:hypothetical protein [uncultured Clostridium sp.]|uniref:hypothetical protein n=1 Tax=uncultured Clostridium sp. TaxID=59620 RepID=UPI002627B145|nr:hypothetical protein [uncultured Clostridium sp.]